MSALLNAGGIQVPQRIIDRGHFKPPVQSLTQNGEGLKRGSGAWEASCEWQRLLIADYLWLRNTLLAGGISRQFGTTQIAGDDGVPLVFSGSIIHRPEFQYVNGGYYHRLRMEIQLW